MRSRAPSSPTTYAGEASCVKDDRHGDEGESPDSSLIMAAEIGLEKRTRGDRPRRWSAFQDPPDGPGDFQERKWLHDKCPDAFGFGRFFIHLLAIAGA